ncbi:MAG: hypothetical protein ABIA76_01745 [Candidatus Diapherotrites archaeon]
MVEFHLVESYSELSSENKKLVKKAWADTLLEFTKQLDKIVDPQAFVKKYEELISMFPNVKEEAKKKGSETALRIAERTGKGMFMVRRIINSAVILASKFPFGRRNSFRAVMADSKLISFMLYKTKNKLCKVNFAWKNPCNETNEFARQFGVSPSKYLFDQLVREGNTHFKGTLLSGGRKMSETAIQKKQVVKEKRVFRVTDSAADLARNRKTIRRI